MLSEMRLIKSSLEYRKLSELDEIPSRLRGIYVLFKKRGKHLNVVYVGMSRGGIKGRLKKHRVSKLDMWSHFSYYEVWDNISDDEITDLEGLFRHIYRFDSRANKLNVQQSHKPLRLLRQRTESSLAFQQITPTRIFEK